MKKEIFKVFAFAVFYVVLFSGYAQAVPAIITDYLLQGSVGSDYRQSVDITGGLPPYAWTVTLGTLPPGLQLDGATGLISGRPSSTGAFSFTVQAADAENTVASKNLMLPVDDHFIVEEWAHFPGNWRNTGSAFDPDGNYYTVGSIYNELGGTDFLIVKYDSAGNEIWRRTHRNTGYDHANSIAIDNTGNIYVVGDSGTFWDVDLVLVKYDASGTVQWTKSEYLHKAYSGRSGVATDSAGNVYVCDGGKDDTGTKIGYVTIKYDASGNKIWKNFYDSGGGSAHSIAVDALGNAYLTGSGHRMGSTTGYDMLTVKLSATGVLLWERSYYLSYAPCDPNWCEESGWDIAVDFAGNSFIAGRFLSGYMWAIMSYDSSGNLRWWATPAPKGWYSEAMSVTTDNMGNAYVLGYTRLTGPYSLIRKYDSFGNELWTKQSDHIIGEWPWSIAVDLIGNVYVTGQGAQFPNGGFTKKFRDTSFHVISPQLSRFGQTNMPFTTTLTAVGGTSPYAWSIIAGSLPSGLTLDSLTGIISGTATTAGTFSFTIQVTDAVSASTTASLSIMIYQPLTITTSSLTSGMQGVSYSQTLTVTDGVSPYAWSVVSGALPAGLSFSSDGAISGTTAAAGTFNFTVRAADSIGNTAEDALSVTINLAPPLTITTSAGVNGAISPAGPQTVGYGQSASFTIMPDTGHHIASLTGCGGTLDGSTFTTAAITADCTVTASFEINRYTVTPAPGASGSMNPSTAQTVDHGQSALFTITPDIGHHIASVTGCGGTLDGSTFTTAAITADCTVTASFEINRYTVIPAPGANGNMNPSTAQTVEHGQSSLFTITPDTGYHIASVTGCGGTLDGSTFTTAAITADCTVTASFEINRYTVIPAPGANGNMNPSTAQMVDYGQSMLFTITPDTGYHIASVTGCGGTLDGSIFTTATVTADCMVSATFNPYIVAAAGPNGSITPAGDITVIYSEPQAFTITPDTGYNISDVLVDGVSVGTAPGYTFTNVNAGHTIFASFTRGVSGSCTPIISPKSSLFNGAEGTGSVTVNVDSQCGWTATSDDSWIRVSNGSGTGNGTLTYAVSQNQTSVRRVGTINISGQTFSVMQLR